MEKFNGYSTQEYANRMILHGAVTQTLTEGQRQAKEKPKKAHTPGPWRVEKDFVHEYLMLIKSPDRAGHRMTSKTVASICYQISGNDQPVEKANANLISAAPELLEACEAALSILDAEHETCGIYKAHKELIQAAVNKAKGE